MSRKVPGARAGTEGLGALIEHIASALPACAQHVSLPRSSTAMFLAALDTMTLPHPTDDWTAMPCRRTYETHWIAAELRPMGGAAALRTNGRVNAVAMPPNGDSMQWLCRPMEIQCSSHCEHATPLGHSMHNAQ
jgi:hypothetical protein